MKLQEADAKTLLVAQGLPVPDWAVAHTALEARLAAERLFTIGVAAVVIKAQVLVGGRGKAGGVKLARSVDEAEAISTAILGMDIKGMTVRKVLVAAAADIAAEFYLSAVLDRAERRIEMHLRARRAQTVTIAKADLTVTLREGETIWTESSHKYAQDEPFQLAEEAGFRAVAQWIDREWPFAETLWIAE